MKISLTILNSYSTRAVRNITNVDISLRLASIDPLVSCT